MTSPIYQRNNDCEASVSRSPHITDAWVAVNQLVWRSALHRCRKVTLDIDTTEIVSHKKSAQWTYKKNKGFMPMVGYIAQVEQVVTVLSPG